VKFERERNVVALKRARRRIRLGFRRGGELGPGWVVEEVIGRDGGGLRCGVVV
jgi:hypothetical protein